jgi:hypothetical protein
MGCSSGITVPIADRTVSAAGEAVPVTVGAVPVADRAFHLVGIPVLIADGPTVSCS